MDVVIRPSEEEACTLAAGLIAQAMRAKPNLTLGLATGRTMERLYAELARMHQHEKLGFSGVHTFNLDEYAGLDATHAASYRNYMNRHLFDKVDIDLQNTFLPDGRATDLEAECARYEQRIAERGGIDVQLLGLGRTGHIGFNEPLSSFRSRTRVVTLTPLTLSDNSGAFEQPGDIPRHALTMGVGTILEARSQLLLVTGAAKADILARVVEGPLTAMLSGTALHFHPAVRVICDEAAAAHLKERDYYDWMFRNDPQWAPFRGESNTP